MFFGCEGEVETTERKDWQWARPRVKDEVKLESISNGNRLDCDRAVRTTAGRSLAGSSHPLLSAQTVAAWINRAALLPGTPKRDGKPHTFWSHTSSQSRPVSSERARWQSRRQPDWSGSPFRRFKLQPDQTCSRLRNDRSELSDLLGDVNVGCHFGSAASGSAFQVLPLQAASCLLANHPRPLLPPSFAWHEGGEIARSPLS